MSSTDIAVRDGERDVVDGWVVMAADVFKLAAHICETDFVPDAYRGNAPAAAAAMLTGRELGLGPMTSLRHVQVVKGSPSLSAEYKRARVLAAGHEFAVLEISTQRCRVRGRRRGSPDSLEITFTMDDARRAGLLAPSKSGRPGAWQQRPRRMLFARAASELCDFLFSDVVNGLPTAELLAEGTDEDAFAGYNEADGQEPPRSAPPKTAQRARRRAEPRPPAAQDAAGPAPATAPAPVQAAPEQPGNHLPPLPGEDQAPPAPAPATGQPAGHEPDGPVTPAQVKAIWTALSKTFHFGPDERDDARDVCAHIVAHPLASSKDLTKTEAKAVLDTLAHWQHQAAEAGEDPRAWLLTVTASASQPQPDSPEGDEPDADAR